MDFKISWPWRASPAHGDDASASNRRLRQNTAAPASRTNTPSALHGLSGRGEPRKEQQGHTPVAPPLPPRPAPALNRPYGANLRSEQGAQQRAGNRTPGIKVDPDSGWRATNFDTTSTRRNPADRPLPSRPGLSGGEASGLSGKATGPVRVPHIEPAQQRIPVFDSTGRDDDSSDYESERDLLDDLRRWESRRKTEENPPEPAITAPPRGTEPAPATSAKGHTGWDNVRIEDHRTWPRLRLFDDARPGSKKLIHGYKLLGLEPDDDVDAVFALAGEHVTLPDPEKARSLDSLERIREMEKDLDDQCDAAIRAYNALRAKHVDITHYDSSHLYDTGAVELVVNRADARWSKNLQMTLDALSDREEELRARQTQV